MAISEIEKLERRYAENPQGLTFAPLAEIHRKNGDVAKALDLLGPGLALHPDYIPASIVLGRCHLDLGDQHAAETAFTHVLGLDGENVIAIKALADITERLLRLDEAERWLHTLLSIDRSNDEAQDQLARVQASRRQAEVASSAAPEAGLADQAPAEAADESPVEALETEPFVADPVVVPTSPPPPPFADLSEPGMAWVSDSDAPSSEEAVPLAFEDLQSETPATFHEPVEPLMGLVGRNDDETLGEEFQVEMSEDIILQSSGASEFQMPNAAEELFGSSAPPPPAPLHAEPAYEPEPVREPESVREPDPVREPEPAMELVAEAAPEPEPVTVPEPQPAAQPDPMVTETMAEVLLSQGHRDDALRVYRELEGRSGRDARLQDKIAELEEIPPAPQSRRQYSATETGGRSAREFFRAMLATRPPHAAPGSAGRSEGTKPGSPAEGSGAPTRPAHDTLSLSSVFGEDGTPTRPAVPAAGPATPGGVSFDDFFNAPPKGGSARPPRAPDSKSDDLDQFHTWLQNLKR